jgi:hypothetical protein
MKMLAKVAIGVAVGCVGLSTALYAKGGIASQGEVNELLGQARADQQSVIHLRVQAEKKHDAIMLQCVNYHLMELKAQLNTAELLANQLGATGSLDALRNQVIDVHKSREAAYACVGEANGGNESSNSYTGPTIPGWNDGYNPVLEDPSPISPVH